MRRTTTKRQRKKLSRFTPDSSAELDRHFYKIKEILDAIPGDWCVADHELILEHPRVSIDIGPSALSNLSRDMLMIYLKHYIDTCNYVEATKNRVAIAKIKREKASLIGIGQSWKLHDSSIFMSF